MTAPSKKTRDITMNLRTTSAVKKMVSAIARADDRSLGNTIEHLIRDETDHRAATAARRSFKVSGPRARKP